MAPNEYPPHHLFGRSRGKRITSRIDSAPVSSMVRRSIPMPIPPAGGIPCSSARRNSSSIFCFSSPACSSRRWRCTSGSFNSLIAWRNLGPVYDQFENIDERVIRCVLFGQRHQLFGQWVTKSGSIVFSSTNFSKTCCVTSKSASADRSRT